LCLPLFSSSEFLCFNRELISTLNIHEDLTQDMYCLFDHFDHIHKHKGPGLLIKVIKESRICLYNYLNCLKNKHKHIKLDRLGLPNYFKMLSKSIHAHRYDINMTNKIFRYILSILSASRLLIKENFGADEGLSTVYLNVPVPLPTREPSSFQLFTGNIHYLLRRNKKRLEKPLFKEFHISDKQGPSGVITHLSCY